mmetsp:Transcript_30247/g.49302  ORF Transcript_30247/g.49302 Transcript_30247/m.49302 type:complete len:135 (+) Transcript_30247:347-751(+)
MSARREERGRMQTRKQQNSSNEYSATLPIHHCTWSVGLRFSFAIECRVHLVTLFCAAFAWWRWSGFAKSSFSQKNHTSASKREDSPQTLFFQDVHDHLKACVLFNESQSTLCPTSPGAGEELLLCLSVGVGDDG